MKHLPNYVYYWLRAMSLSLSILIILVGCQSRDLTLLPTAASTIEISYPPSAVADSAQTTTPAPTLLSTLTSVPFQTPMMPTPLPTLSSLPPQATLSTEGPWLVFEATMPQVPHIGGPRAYLWATNADGTGTGLLTDSDATRFCQPNPYDRIIVCVYFSRPVPTLKMIRLPEGTETDICPIATEEFYAQLSELSDPLLSAYYELGGLAWSRDGTKLAFVGALDEVSVDVYVYDFTANRVSRVARLRNDYMSVIPRPTGLRWSPDGQYVLYSVFDHPTMGFTELYGWYAAQIESGLISRATIPDNPGLGHYPPDLRWWGTGHVALLSDKLAGFSSGDHIGILDLETGEYTDIYVGEYHSYAVSREHDVWLIVFTSHHETDTEPSIVWIRDGVITELPNPQLIHYVEWLENEGVFMGCSSRASYGCYTIKLDGELVETERSFWDDYYQSPDNAMLALVNVASDGEYHSAGVWIGDSKDTLREIDVQEHTRRDDPQYLHVHRATWSPDSQHFIMLTNRGLYVASAPDFELVNFGGYLFGDVNNVKWID